MAEVEGKNQVELNQIENGTTKEETKNDEKSEVKIDKNKNVVAVKKDEKDSVQLHPHLIDELFEMFILDSKSFADNDLRTNWKGKLVCIKPIAFIAPFVKFKALEATYHPSNPDNSEENQSEDFAFFRNPHSMLRGTIVSAAFVFKLLKREKLRIEALSSRYLFSNLITDDDKESDGVASLVSEWVAEAGVADNKRTFARVFLDRGRLNPLHVKDPASIKGKMETLRSIAFRECFAALKNIDFMLHFDAENVSIAIDSDSSNGWEISKEEETDEEKEKEADNENEEGNLLANENNESEAQFFYPLPAPPLNTFVAERVRHVKMECSLVPVVDGSTGEFPVAQWSNYLRYILSACPKLESLEVRIYNQESPLPFDSRLKRFKKCIDAVTNALLPGLTAVSSGDGRMMPKVIIEFRDFMHFFDREELDKVEHVPLLTLGEPFERGGHLDEGEICRRLTVPAAGGNIEHECILSLFNSYDDDEIGYGAMMYGDNDELNQIIEDNLDPEYWPGGSNPYAEYEEDDGDYYYNANSDDDPYAYQDDYYDHEDGDDGDFSDDNY